MAFSQWGSYVGGTSVAAGTWHSFGVTTVGDLITLYLDGNVVGTDTLPIDTPAGTDFYIGRIPGEIGDIRQLVGAVDEVRLYDTALSPSEMQALAAIPEPSSILLVVMGMLGLALYRVRCGVATATPL